MKKYHLKYLVLAASLFSLNSCAANKSNSWSDPNYQEKSQAAEAIFHEHHPEQASKFYKEALQRAFLANSPQAIHDAGFNLALSYSAQNDNQNALTTILETENALKERQSSSYNDAHNKDLTLLKALIFYHQKQWENAKENALKAEKTSEKAVFIKSLYLQGLIAFEEQELPTLTNILTRYKAISDLLPTDRVNLLELKIDQELLSHQWELTYHDVEMLIEQRRLQNHYDAMRRALAKKEEILRALGKNEEADMIQTQIQESLQNEH